MTLLYNYTFEFYREIGLFYSVFNEISENLKIGSTFQKLQTRSKYYSFVLVHIHSYYDPFDALTTL